MAGLAGGPDEAGADQNGSGMAGAWTALVLATCGPDHPVAINAGVANRHLADIHGRSALQRTLDVLRASPSVGRIVVAIEDAEGLNGLAPRPEAAKAAPALVDTVGAALGQLGPPLLIVAADHPLTSPDLIEGFLAATIEAAAGVALAVVPATDDLAAEALPLADGDFAAAGLYAFASADARRAVDVWRKHAHLVHEPKALARALDPWALGLYVVGRLTLKRAMERLSKRIGLKMHAVIAPMPEAALTLSTPENLALARRRIAGRTIRP